MGLSLLWAIAPAAAAAPSRTTLSSSTPSIGAGSIAKLKAVVKQTSGTLLPTGPVTFREGTTATSPAVAPAVTLATVNGVPTAKLDVPGLSSRHPHVHRDLQRIDRLQSQHLADHQDRGHGSGQVRHDNHRLHDDADGGAR